MRLVRIIPLLPFRAVGAPGPSLYGRMMPGPLNDRNGWKADISDCRDLAEAKEQR